MMTAGTTLFKSLQQPRFTGQFIFKDADDESWIFHFYMGRIIYVNGGIHTIRRWVRNLTAYCPQLTDPLEEAQKLLRSAEVPSAAMGWQYQVLCQWAIQRKITREQVQRLIRGMVVEALFDVLQARCINYRTQADNSLPNPPSALRWRK
jgi:chemotaxis family two-component system response regulator PixG